MLTDVEIMIRVQAGETGLFAELVSRYQARLLRFARTKHRESAGAEDLVQETFLAAFQARHSYSTEFAFSTWIWTILLNLSRRAYARQIREQQRVEQLQERSRNSVESDTGLQLLIDAEQKQQLHDWLDQLPQEQADALRLRFFGELPYEEIALAMESSISGAKRRVKNGLIRLGRLADPSSSPPGN